MKQNGLRALAATLNHERRFSGGGAGGELGSGKPLGSRVSCGQQHNSGVNVREAMRRARSYGTLKVDFSEEVRHLE